ncbi:MAG: lysophospholipid acyltransferase family protein [Clostridiales bacterium]
MYKIFIFIARFLLKFLSRFEVIDKHNLPQNGGVIIACTHVGWADVPYIGLASLPRKTFFMAKKEIFSNKLIAWFLNEINVFKVDRKNPGADSIKQASDLLENGEALVIYPAGTRENSGKLKRGVISLSQNAKVPMVPAFYIGPEKISFTHLFKRPNVKIIYGEPIKFPTIEELNLSPKELKNYQINKISELENVYLELEIKAKK